MNHSSNLTSSFLPTLQATKFCVVYVFSVKVMDAEVDIEFADCLCAQESLGNWRDKCSNLDFVNVSYNGLPSFLESKDLFDCPHTTTIRSLYHGFPPRESCLQSFTQLPRVRLVPTLLCTGPPLLYACPSSEFVSDQGGDLFDEDGPTMPLAICTSKRRGSMKCSACTNMTNCPHLRGLKDHLEYLAQNEELEDNAEFAPISWCIGVDDEGVEYEDFNSGGNQIQPLSSKRIPVLFYNETMDKRATWGECFLSY